MLSNYYVVLDFLTVKPAFHRQGVATLLVKAGCEIADAYCQKAYACASPAGLKVYERQDFGLVETVSTDYSQFGATEPYVRHFMVRQPVFAEAKAPDSSST
jgi:GNAT superfamily N-acetyltransferase